MEVDVPMGAVMGMMSLGYMQGYAMEVDWGRGKSVKARGGMQGNAVEVDRGRKKPVMGRRPCGYAGGVCRRACIRGGEEEGRRGGEEEEWDLV